MRYTQRLAIHPGRVLAREIDFLSICEISLAYPESLLVI